MKTKFKYVTLLAVALVMGFSSCGNEDDVAGGEDSKEPKSVFLKITGKTPGTFAEGTAVVDGSAVSFTSGHLYFVNNAGVIKSYYTLTNAATAGTNININDITTAGSTVQNLPGDVNSVHIVGNSAGLPTAGPIAAVLNQALAVQSQDDANGGVANVNLYGTGGLVAGAAPAPGQNQLYTCTVNLKPTAARIELTDIEAVGNITGFDVEGIFIDNYYSKASVNGVLDIANYVSNGPVAAAFNDVTAQYPVALKPSIYDFYNPALAAIANVVKPAVGKEVWGYNVFANNSEVPRIIIRLNNITVDPLSGIAPIVGPHFITIRGLKNGANAIPNIEPGKVYNIGAGTLKFDEADITNPPNLQFIDVEVTVTLATWTVVDVTPEI